MIIWQAVEMQKEIQCNQFREMLKEKEEEIQILTNSFQPDEVKISDNRENEKVKLDSNSLEEIEDLKRQLKEERETHQNEMMALQVIRLL